jgi:hypothetical protein
MTTHKTHHASPEENAGSISRLNDHLKQHRIVQQHIQHHTIDELQFYPEHDARTESKEYVAVHKKMTVQEDLPCLVCGVRNSTLKDPKANRYQAKQMETHHHIVEWSLANAIDVDRFNAAIRPNLAHKHPNDPTWHYEQPFSVEQIRQWVDHSEHNLWVLCDVHHRAKYLGIHEITYPIWCPQDLFRPDFDQWALQQIQELKQAGHGKEAHKGKNA